MYQGACGELFEWNFPTRGGSVQDLNYAETILALFAFCLISHSIKKQLRFVVVWGLVFLCSC